MGSQRKLSPDDPDFAERVVEIARLAVADAIAEHHAAGRPVCYRRNGALVKAYPDGREIPVDGEAAEGGEQRRSRVGAAMTAHRRGGSMCISPGDD